MVLRLMIATVLILSVATAVDAQHPQTDRDRQTLASFETLPNRVKLGQTVYVTDPQAQETEGRLVRVSDTSLTLLVQGTERLFPRTEIRQVARRGDSLANGFGSGMGIGAGLVILSEALSDEPEVNDVDQPGAGLAAAVTVFFAGVGGTVGALADRAIKGKTVVYRATPVTVTAVPILRPRGGGLGVALRF